MTVELNTLAPKKWTADYSGVAPTIDVTDGVLVGDFAIDSSTGPAFIWRCLDNTDTAPVWDRISQGLTDTIVGIGGEAFTIVDGMVTAVAATGVVSGDTGAQGATGVAGAAGAVGDTGVAGSNGSDGNTGAAGTNGTDGNTGATGDTGIAGSVGQTGAQGATGVQLGNTGITDTIHGQLSDFTVTEGIVSGATGVFEVTDLPGLVLWLDVNQLTGFSDGDGVTTWTDYSEFGNDAVAASGVYEALYKTNIVNGYPILRFDGSNDWYDISAGIYNSADNRSQGTMIFVLKHTENADARFCEYNNTAENVYISLQQDPTSSGQLAFIEAGATDFVGISAASDTDWEVFYVSWTNDQYANFYINHTLVSQAALGTMNNSTTDGIRIGRGRGANTNWFGGDIANVIWCNVALGAEDRIAITNFLMDKYAIT